jgi:hypothetical protein
VLVYVHVVVAMVMVVLVTMVKGMQGEKVHNCLESKIDSSDIHTTASTRYPGGRPACCSSWTR